MEKYRIIINIVLKKKFKVLVQINVVALLLILLYIFFSLHLNNRRARIDHRQFMVNCINNIARVTYFLQYLTHIHY